MRIRQCEDPLSRNLGTKKRDQADGVSLKLLVESGSSPVTRQAHNLKVVGSNPAPATNLKPSGYSNDFGGFLVV